MFLKISNMKMHTKLIISYMLISFIPISLLGAMSVIYFRDFAFDFTLREIHSDFDSIRLRILEITNNVVSIANRLMIDQNLQEIVSYRYKNPMEVYLKYSEYKEIDTYKLLYSKTISHIRIYSENPTLLENGVFYRVDDYIREKSWYELAYQLDGLFTWDLIYEGRDLYPNSYLSLVRLLKNQYSERFGVLVINLNPTEISNILKTINFKAFLVDKNGRVIAGNGENCIGEELDISLSESSKREGYDTTIEGEKYRIIGVPLTLPGEREDFYLVSIIPLDVILREPLRMQNLALSTIFATAVLSISLIFIFSRTMSKRVSLLNQGVKEISQGNWDFNITVEGSDEIGELAENIGNMAQDIKKLIEEVYLSNLREKETKLKLLTSQLNPHFLFNTLQTIHFMAITDGQKEIADISIKLGNLLRKSIELEDLVRLETEISLIRDYLEIQMHRFDRISYNVDVSGNIDDVYILPFLLQPVVENSIIHGLQEKSYNGFIKISIDVKEKDLTIVVEDNGVGMDEQTLQMINSRDYTSVFQEKTGIKNTIERIKLFYGENYGLRVQSQKEKGTRVEIFLPAMRKGESV
ncbi:MAG TPA: histidine kinase [Candidatus Atribacteria bacterium]|nr:histidine kinase [Candidatus Atribacteria bacterium]